MKTGAFEEFISDWHGIEPLAHAETHFLTDAKLLIEKYRGLPLAEFEEEPSSFMQVLADQMWPTPAKAPAPGVVEGDLCRSADAVASGELSAVALVQDCLERIGASQDLNAIIRLEADAALARAADIDRMVSRGAPVGPLAGVPLGHKDMFYRQGEICTCGSRIRSDFRPQRTATVMSRLDERGAIYLAALNMSEFAQGPTGSNRHFGTVRNPWNTQHISGGSSSGSAAAVAAGLVFGSLCSDTGGSIRMPASACGVTGLKPTWSRVSRYGTMPLAPSVDCIGPIARSARDCARLFSAIAGYDSLDSSTTVSTEDFEIALDGNIGGIRLGLPSAYFLDNVEEVIMQRLEEAMDVLEARGARRTKAEISGLTEVAVLSGILSRVEIGTLHADWMRSRGHDYAAHVRDRMYPALAIPGVYYYEALRRRGKVTETFVKAAFENADVLVMPTLKRSPPTIEETDIDAGVAGAAEKFMSIGVNTRFFNYLGLPAITIPIGLDDNRLPVGLQLVGRPFAESLLLRIADAFQRDTGWHRARPS